MNIFVKIFSNLDYTYSCLRNVWDFTPLGTFCDGGLVHTPGANALRQTRFLALLFYGLGVCGLIGAWLLSVRPAPSPVHTLQRALARGEVAAGLPYLNPQDAHANAAILQATLDEVASLGAPGGRPCARPVRSFPIEIQGSLHRVRIPARVVCQLQLLKQISIAQPGFGPRGLAEVAAFFVGHKTPASDGAYDVLVSRLVIPPFRFDGATLTFSAADVGPLAPGEAFLGTYHTHPEGDLTQGVLSETDLEYLQKGSIDFSGQVGPLASAHEPTRGLDWLFDIVDTRDGDWSVYAHDVIRLTRLHKLCVEQPPCPLNQLRIAGSPFHLLARVYDEP